MHWTDLIHIVIFLTTMMSWCFYFQFNRALLSRKKLVYIEVMSKDKIITRIISKQNLNTVIVSNNRKRTNNVLFDKFWYQKREQHLNQADYNGFYIDNQGLVA